MALPANPLPKFDRLPKHVAVIMDGNGRWARKRGLPRIAGHKVGIESVREVIRAARELGIGHLTLYAFSTENWSRPKSEVGFIMRLLTLYLKRERSELHEKGVRVASIGRIEGLPAALFKELKACMEFTAGNRGMVLTLALNYGARQEILDAARRFPRRASGGRARSGATDEDRFSALLGTAGMPDVDFVIRTSGEMRLSNFLLWQVAYAELYFTPTYWPDFRRPQFLEALRDYARRERRFGDIAPRSA